LLFAAAALTVDPGYYSGARISARSRIIAKECGQKSSKIELLSKTSFLQKKLKWEPTGILSTDTPFEEISDNCSSDKGVPPPGVVVAARRGVKDPKNEAQYGERVPYVIARGLPGERLADRAIDPVEFMNNR